MKATNISNSKGIEISKDTIIEINNTFIANGIEYIIASTVKNGWGELVDIEVMEKDEFIKSHTVKVCEDGETRTLKEIEDMEKET